MRTKSGRKRGISPNSEIGGVFMKAHNGQTNFMTPEIVEYGEAGSLYYELSTGRFMGSTLWGVTFLTKYGERCHGINKCHPSEYLARRHIAEVAKINNGAV